MNVLVLIGVILIASGILLLAVVFVARRRSAGAAPQPRTVADLVRLREETGGFGAAACAAGPASAAAAEAEQATAPEVGVAAIDVAAPPAVAPAAADPAAADGAAGPPPTAADTDGDTVARQAATADASTVAPCGRATPGAAEPAAEQASPAGPVPPSATGGPAPVRPAPVGPAPVRNEPHEPDAAADPEPSSQEPPLAELSPAEPPPAEPPPAEPPPAEPSLPLNLDGDDVPWRRGALMAAGFAGGQPWRDPVPAEPLRLRIVPSTATRDSAHRTVAALGTGTLRTGAPAPDEPTGREEQSGPDVRAASVEQSEVVPAQAGALADAALPGQHAPPVEEAVIVEPLTTEAPAARVTQIATAAVDGSAPVIIAVPAGPANGGHAESADGDDDEDEDEGMAEPLTGVSGPERPGDGGVGDTGPGGKQTDGAARAASPPIASDPDGSTPRPLEPATGSTGSTESPLSTGADGAPAAPAPSGSTLPGEMPPVAVLVEGGWDEVQLEPVPAGAVPERFAEPASDAVPEPGRGGTSPTDRRAPAPGSVERGSHPARPTPDERAAEQAAADLALLRTFGVAESGDRSDGAHVVVTARPEDGVASDPSGPVQPVRYRAVHRDGSVVGGAAVTLLDDGGGDVASGRADADGRGRLLAPAPGSYVLVSTAPGHQPGAVALTVAAAPTETEVQLARSASVSGAVRGEGGPIARARVTLVQDGEVVDAVDTDDGGAYRFGDIGAGEYGLSVAAADHRPVAVVLDVAEEADVGQDVDLVAARPAEDADGGTVTGGAMSGQR